MTTVPPESLDVVEAARQGDWDALRRHFDGQHPADIADAILAVDEAHRKDTFLLVDADTRPDVLAELNEREEADDIVRALSDQELSDIVEDMSPDDAADVIAELDEERSHAVLTRMEDEDSEEVRALLAFEPESAGGIMTNEVLALPRRLSVAQALQAIAKLDMEEPFYTLFVVDREQTLVGSIGLWELIRLPPDTSLAEAMHPDPVRVQAGVDQEHVAQIMKKYDLNSLPVVTPGGRLIGRITIDDVLDVISDEATEDMLRMAGTDDSELTGDTAWASCRARLPWLLITLFNGFLTSMLMDRFMSRLHAVIVLSLFIPMVMAMGGNTGIQTSIVFVRNLALGNLTFRNARRMLFRELRSGLLMGFICGALITLWVPVVMRLTGATAPFPAYYVGAVAGASLFIAMTLAAVLGGVFPLLFTKLRIDPATSCGPLITAAIDFVSLAVYFGVSLLLVAVLTGG